MNTELDETKNEYESKIQTQDQKIGELQKRLSTMTETEQELRAKLIEAREKYRQAMEQERDEHMKIMTESLQSNQVKKKEILISYIPCQKSGIYWFHVCCVTVLYVLTCVHDNSKTFSRISFKLGTHMCLGKRRHPIVR